MSSSHKDTWKMTRQPGLSMTQLQRERQHLGGLGVHSSSPCSLHVAGTVNWQLWEHS